MPAAARAVLLASAALVLAGCAEAFKTTPQQDYVYTLFEQCKKETSSYTVYLDYVSPDGRAQYSGREGDIQRMEQCIREKEQAKRRK